MTFVLQASLILHILLHPYTSGRQYRLELWSLTAILVTLFLSLYIIEGINKGVAAVALSAVVLIVHIFVVLGKQKDGFVANFVSFFLLYCSWNYEKIHDTHLGYDSWILEEQSS
jgi:hypothetical protein